MGSVHEVLGGVLTATVPPFEHCAQSGAQHFCRFISETAEKSIWEDGYLVHMVGRKS